MHYEDLKQYIKSLDLDRFILVAEAETVVHKMKNNQIVPTVQAGGVSIALAPIVAAANGIFIGRGRTEEDRQVIDKTGKVQVSEKNDQYSLKRIFLTEEEVDNYYYGFSNQTLWPLCHVAFERPEFHKTWFDGYKKVNKKFATALLEEMKDKTFVWINDYQLALVPGYLARPKNAVIGMFWHIPWPTWEVFRILPQKKELLESMLSCDFLAFHRGYQTRNFLETVQRELGARIDEETGRVYYNDSATTIRALPMGIDTDVIKSLIRPDTEESALMRSVRNTIGIPSEMLIQDYFSQRRLILSVDRLDYTKGLLLRVRAIDRLLERHPSLKEKVVYIGVLAPSREKIASYRRLKKELLDEVKIVNEKYGVDTWKPIELINSVFAREDVLNFLSKASVCLITPRDDGMNLVSKEFVIASSFSQDPGVLVLSQFAGSAIDLKQALIVNPYDTDEVAAQIKRGLDMSKKERRDRIQAMVEVLEEKNIYQWAIDFIKNSLTSAIENRKYK